MRPTVIVGLLTIVHGLAYADEGVRTLDSAPLETIEFERSATRVQRESLGDIQAAAEWQARHPDALLVLEGHTSHAGSSARNVRISEARTDAVRTALVAAGADASRIASVAHSDPRGSDQVVVIRATDAFPDLVREQRDPNIGEDARRRAQETRRAAAAPAAPAPTTVVVVPPAVSAPPPAANPPPPEEDSTAGSTTGLPAGGMAPTTGGNGISAQAGIGMDPTDGSPEFTTGFGPREGDTGTGDVNGAPGLVLPPGAPGARPPGSPGGQVAGAPTE